TEDDRARAFSLDGCAETARSRVVEIGHLEDASAATATCESAIAFGTREGKMADAEAPDLPLHRLIDAVDDGVSPPVVGVVVVEIRGGVLRRLHQAAVLRGIGRGGGDGVTIRAEVDMMAGGAVRR